MQPDGIKSAPFKVKAAGEQDGLKEGQFEGYASVFGNTDSYGDIVQPGAFLKSLAEWEAKGDPIPLLWGHDLEDPFSNVGVIDHAEEDDHGLKVRGTFDLENPKATQVYKLAKGRRTTGMSFAYAIRDSEQKDGNLHLKDLELFEASIVPIGANPLAGVEAVKSGVAALKADLSADSVAALREARDSIDSVLASLDDEDEEDAPASDNDQEKQASGDAEAKSDASDEEPPAKSPVSDEEPKASSSVARLAAQAHIYSLGRA